MKSPKRGKTGILERSILGIPLKILFLLKGLVEAFVECIYATEKQIPG